MTVRAATLTIEALGRRGDGIATRPNETGHETLHLPFTAPGDEVSLSDDGAIEIVNASARRQQPFCAYFGTCGGCQMQHIDEATYRAWKTGLLREALAREGIEVPIRPMVSFARNSRRRAVLSARKTSQGWVLGFQARGSHTIIDVDTCPILTDQLAQALPAARDLLPVIEKYSTAGSKVVRFFLVACDNGTDCAITLTGKVSDRLIRETAKSEAARRFARITFKGELAFERVRPEFSAGRARVSPPPGAFVQAVAAAEAAMAQCVTAHLANCRRVADLFCGFGGFALQLAENSLVLASDSEGTALAALERAWRETGGKLKQISIEKRDLFQRPFMANELKGIDGAVFDPPRAGAEAQAEQLAASKVGKIVAVSCNPVTLARDLRILVDGGFAIDTVTPIDQFAYTPHLEAVVTLTR